MSNKQEEEKLKLLHDRAWKYFELHANQRTTLFRYFIVFASLYITGIALKINGFSCKGISSEVFVIISSAAFIMVTVIFIFLDNRNRDLINIGESSLKNCESMTVKNNKNFKDLLVFKKEGESKPQIKHTACYRIIFFTAIIVSLAFSHWAVYSLSDGKDDCSTKHISIDGFPADDPKLKNLKLDTAHQPSSACDK